MAITDSNPLLAERHRRSFSAWMYDEEVSLNAGAAVQVEKSERYL